MTSKRKKITVYLHPEVYEQDALTESHIGSVPYSLRGAFYRESIIVGAALSSLDPRLLPLISGMYSGEFTAEHFKTLIDQVLAGGDKRVPPSPPKPTPMEEPASSLEDREKIAMSNLNKLKF